MDNVGKLHKSAFLGILEIKGEKGKTFIPQKTYSLTSKRIIINIHIKLSSNKYQLIRKEQDFIDLKEQE